MVRDGEGGREDAEDEEGLGGALVLDVVLDGVLEEVLGLGPDLGGDEAREDERVGRLADVREVRGDRELPGRETGDSTSLQRGCSARARVREPTFMLRDRSER